MIDQRDGLALSKGDRVVSEDSANKDEIKWGAEIEVGDAKPDFLKQSDVEDMLIVFNGGFARMPVTGCDSLDKWGWNVIKGIRLPADHPYYAQEKADEAFAAKLLDADVRGVMRRRERQEDVATTAIDPALVERMGALDLQLYQRMSKCIHAYMLGKTRVNGRSVEAEFRDIFCSMPQSPSDKFMQDNEDWALLDRAELIERVLAWKETNA